MAKRVMLTDENGTPTGEADFREAHTGEGLLHRAFSVFVFNPLTADVLIQRRSKEKMLWPEIWANTCCSHLRTGETLLEAGRARLKEELGFDCPLVEGPSFVYKAQDPGRGVEHEYDTILLGKANPEKITADPKEASEWKWISIENLQEELKTHPLSYAPWLHLSIAILLRNRNTPDNV